VQWHNEAYVVGTGTHIHNSTLQGSLALNILSKEKEKKRKASKTLERQAYVVGTGGLTMTFKCF
jgi:hypothetical protein